MLCPTITFALFFMVVLPTSWFLMHQRFRWQLFILAASYFFYGYYDWRFCFLLAGSTLVNQMVGLQIYSSERESVRRAWLTVGIVANLGALGYFKYYDFFVGARVTGWVVVGPGRVTARRCAAAENARGVVGIRGW